MQSAWRLSAVRPKIKGVKMGKKVLFVNQEIKPYVPESEMSTFGYDIPNIMQGEGYEIRSFMPKWGNINERRGQLHEVIRLSGINVIIDDTDHPLIIKVASIPQTRIQVYFIDNEDYFQKRKMTQDEMGNDYPDNGERAIFFARGVLETVKKLRWTPDVIHCQGWMSSVIPFYVKTAYKDEPQFANAKVVTTIFHDQPRGDFGSKFKKILELRDAKASMIQKYGDKFDFMELGKLAIDYSDGIVETGNDVNAQLIDYAQANNKPMLVHPEDGVGSTYKDFYEKLLAE
jgi:starch synthase